MVYINCCLISFHERMSEDTTHLQLSALVFKRSAKTIPLDVVSLLGKELLENLTLRQLLYLCIACKKRPSAQMLAFALQNSVPSLVGLPMDNPDPEFYLNIAKVYFDPEELDIVQKSFVYSTVHNFPGPGQFFPSYIDLETVHDYGLGSHTAMHYYTLFAMSRGVLEVIHTKKGREFVRDVFEGWRRYYEKEKPDDPRYNAFIDNIINAIDHGFVLQNGHLMPGRLGILSRQITPTGTT